MRPNTHKRRWWKLRRLEGQDLHLSIRDDGIGGADAAKGSGITGLRDRVRRSAAPCRFRVTQELAPNCVPRSRSKLLHRPTQMAPRQRLCSTDSFEGCLHGSAIAGDEYRGRGG